jgi:hypothetical protein
MAKHARKDCLLTKLTSPLDDQYWPEAYLKYANEYCGKEGVRIPERVRFGREYRPYLSRITLKNKVSSFDFPPIFSAC